MTPLLLKSTLTKPPRWFVATRYRQKEGTGLDGVMRRYIVAQRKYDVTDQMERIIAHERQQWQKQTRSSNRKTSRNISGSSRATSIRRRKRSSST